MSNVRGEYGESANGNFRVKDTIPVPHPYCITPKHVAVASDHHCGRLGEPAIIDAERRGATCGICKGKLDFKAHETALLVECFTDPKKDTAAHEELTVWLKSIVDEATNNGYAGFAFLEPKAKVVTP